MNQIDAYTVLGVRVHSFQLETFFGVISQCIETKNPCVIGHHNLHSVYLYHRDTYMREFYETVADYVFIDGMPLVMWGKLLGLPLTRQNRFTGVDWLPLVLKLCAEQGWRVYYLGGTADVSRTGIRIFQDRFVNLEIKAHHGYFYVTSAAVNHALCEEIAAWQTDLLLVGMGMPRQERWILEQRANLDVPCIMPVGAALDYVAGAIPTPPRWMSRLGFEWLARLIAEPRRLGQRYLVEPWFLMPYAIADLGGYLKRRRE